ncbi:MAG: transcription termination/antitermination NusG family protein [Bryobacteraceae bacterium]
MPLFVHEVRPGSRRQNCSIALEESQIPGHGEPIDKHRVKTHDWLAVLVKSHFERYVSLSIRSKGIEEFLPTYVRKGFGQNSHNQVHEPLFPGYLFCKPAAHERLSVLKIPGIVSFVGAGKQPFPVEEEEIAAIRKMVSGPVPICLWPYTRTGQRVRIEKGPLAGIEGIVVSTKGSWRVVVSITLLQRSVAAEVELNSLSCI